MNVTEGLFFIADDRIKFCKEEAGTSTFNQFYEKLQANKDNFETRQLLDIS